MEPDNTLKKELIYGTWRPVPDQWDYRFRRYTKDSAYVVDGGNWGFQVWNNKWWWGTGDTLHFTWGSTTVHWQRVEKLTNDSLVIYYSSSPLQQFRYYRE